MAPLTMSAQAMDVVASRKEPPRSWYVDLTMLGRYWGGGTTTRAHLGGTAEGTARPAAAARGGAQRSARPGRAATRTGPSAARCASAGDTAANHPVAATDCAATPLLQPAAAKPAVVPGSEGAWPRWPARARRR